MDYYPWKINWELWLNMCSLFVSRQPYTFGPDIFLSIFRQIFINKHLLIHSTSIIHDHINSKNTNRKFTDDLINTTQFEDLFPTICELRPFKYKTWSHFFKLPIQFMLRWFINKVLIFFCPIIRRGHGHPEINKFINKSTNQNTGKILNIYCTN